MELLIVLIVFAIAAVVRGCLVYVLWNWIFIGDIGLSIPTLSFTLCCVIGIITGLLFG